MPDNDSARAPHAVEADLLRKRNAELEEQIAELRAVICSLQEGERRFRYMIEHQGEGVAIVDLEERFLYSNRSADRLFGVPRGELLNRSLQEFVTPEQFSYIRRETNIRRAGKTSTYELEIVRGDGAKRNLSVIAAPWFDRNKRVCGALSSFRDTTDLKIAEAQVRLERDRAQRYLDVAGVMLVAVDASQRVVLMNRKGCELLGYREDEIVGNNWFDTFLPQRVRDGAKRVFRRLMAGETKLAAYHENPVLVRDGGERLIAWRNTLLTDDTGNIVGTLSSGEDITDRRRAQHELVRLERLRAMGEMTAGISHNLNNILVGVLGHAQFLQKATAEPKILKEVDAIIRSARRAEDLVQRLRQAVLGREEELEPVSVNEVVSDAVRDARPRWRSKRDPAHVAIEVIPHLKKVPLIRGTRSELRDILTNLLLNAADAMPKGGTVTISTESASGGVELAVCDTGSGMDEETSRRVFEPFFTTKAEVGTGLGLSTVYGAVTRWGGTVEVHSTLEEGTRFKIWLPNWTGVSEVAVRGPGRGKRHGRRAA